MSEHRQPADASIGNGPVGRPRRTDVEALVCGRALHLAAQVGYAGATLELIALTSGVSKSTIYRRWPSKDVLYVHAIERHFDTLPPAPPGASVADIVDAAVQSLVDRLLYEGVAAALAGVFAQATVDSELRRMATTRLREPHAKAVAERLDISLDRAYFVVDLVFGTVLHHHGIAGEEYSALEARRLACVVTHIVTDNL